MVTRRPTAPRSERRPATGAGRASSPRPGPGRGPGAARTTTPPRPSTRPAPAARGRSGATASAAERRRTRGPRVLVLSALVLVLAIFLVPSFQKWLEQRSEIGRLTAQISQAQDDLAASQAQEDRWADDAYVMTQARSRLDYVMPGEVPYVVDGGSADADAVAPAQAAAAVPKSSVAWYENVWESLRIAGDPDGTGAGTPSGRSSGVDR